MLSKIKQFVEVYQEELFLLVLLAIVAVTGFGLGKITSVGGASGADLVISSTPVSATGFVAVVEQSLVVEEGSSEPTNVVGNKNSKVFHLSTCSGAQRMSDKNKIYFATIADAQSAGYRPAGNCPGLQ